MRATICLTGWILLALPAMAVGADKDAVARRLSAAIDKHLAADWADRKINPAATATDAEYCRRVYLDLIGRIPRVAEAREFIADADPDKRAKLVEKLLATPAHASHFASLSRADWLPQSLTNPQTVFQGNQFEDWLRKQYAANVPFDEIAKKLLTATVAVGQRGRVSFDNRFAETDQAALAAFYQVNDVKPETIAAAASRIFLGIKIECAQCHDHPFAPYTKDQFWEFAAFFGEFTPLPPASPSFVGPQLPQSDTNRLTIPNTTRMVTARYFDGTDPDWSVDRTPRQELAGWLATGKNVYFATNLANRLWAQFFGLGIVDPVDEPGDNNPPSHPDLLAELAAGYAEAGFDQQVMIRAITASRAYNLTSEQTDPTQADPRRFAKANVRGLTGHQIYDSFLAATGSKDQSMRNRQFIDPRNDSGRIGFLNLFTANNKPTESQTSILQALMLMNGQIVTDQTSIAKSQSLAAILDAPFLDTDGKLDALFLAALTRPPTPAEREKYGSYIDRGGPSGDKQKAVTDIFWVLLNSTEFLFNH